MCGKGIWEEVVWSDFEGFSIGFVVLSFSNVGNWMFKLVMKKGNFIGYVV